MNPDESALYSDNYFGDMAFFSAKFMTHRFDRRVFVDIALEKHYNEHILKPIEPTTTFDRPLECLQAEAVHDKFTTTFEKQMYNVISQVILASKLDEGVAIGALVLLDILKDITTRADYSPVPAYPHDDYFYLYLGAFMLSYRIVSNDKSVPADYWEEVLAFAGIEMAEEDILKHEEDFRRILEDNVGRDNVSFLSSDEGFLALDFKYSGGPGNIVPPNPFIKTVRFKQMKATMYSHIRIRMIGRGEEPVDFDCGDSWSILDCSLEFPPCYPYMIQKTAIVEEARIRFPNLRRASNWEIIHFVYSY